MNSLFAFLMGLLGVYAIGDNTPSLPPTMFVLHNNAQQASNQRIYGWINGIPESVDVDKSNDRVTYSPSSSTALQLKPTASSTSDAMLDYTVDYFASFSGGEGMRFSFRTTRVDFPTKKGIQLALTANGAKVFENGKLIASNDTLRLEQGVQHRINISNNGKKFAVAVNCIPIITGRTELPETEYLIVESLAGTTSSVSGIVYDDFYVND